MQVMNTSVQRIIDGRPCSITLGSTKIPPFGSANINAREILDGQLMPGEVFVPSFLHKAHRASFVQILDVVSQRRSLIKKEGVLRTFVDLPLEGGVQALMNIPQSLTDYVCVTVRNQSNVEQVFEGAIHGGAMSASRAEQIYLEDVGKPVQPAEQENPEVSSSGNKKDFASGLLDKCVDWFSAGVKRAVAEANESQETLDSELYCDSCGYAQDDFVPRYQRIRDRLREVVLDIIDVASFPLKAALHLTSKSLGDLKLMQEPPRPITIRTFVLASGKTDVGPGESVNITFQSQVNFKPSIVVIPVEIRDKFLITDIKIGKNSQFLSATPVPANAFAFEDGTPIALKMDVARPGQLITLSITNTWKDIMAFSATLVGSVEDWQYE